MRKLFAIGVVVVVAGGAAAYFGVFSRRAAADRDSAQAGAPGAGPGGARGGAPNGARAGAARGTAAQGGGGMGGPGGFGGGGPRAPMTVELTSVKRGDVAAHLTVVGNLIGEQTVDVAPKTSGRLVSVSVQLGDRVRRGQAVAKIEDREIVEQVRQADASAEVAKATIRQREADLKVAEVNFERSRNLYARQLLAKQALDDAESRYLAALAQVDLSKAQLLQNQARLEELRINLQNTTVVAPVDGFVGKRNVDAGAMVSQNSPVVSVVDIGRMRLVANVIEKDLRMVSTGDEADVEVDAYPGDHFRGHIARVAPVLDPATRTAAMEVEIPNRDFRLKPGMYARVSLTIERRTGALVAPRLSVIDFEDRRGVWMATEENRARFVPVELGIEDEALVEIVKGLKEGDRIVGAGATAVRNGDQLIIAGAGAPGAGPGGPRGSGGPRASQGGGPTPGGAAPGAAAGARPGGRGAMGATGEGRPQGMRPPR